jgi:hypothetical protein
MCKYKGLTVRTFADVRKDTETREARKHRVNMDATVSEYLTLRRHAEAAGCSNIELIGAIVRQWIKKNPIE